MAQPYLVVIGASAGGVGAVRELLRAVPGEVPAAFCVVVHTAPGFESMLPELLEAACSLSVSHARTGDPIRAGHVLVAPPDRHLIIRDTYVQLTHGPRENHARPAIDPALRSAARAHGRALAGVVLSGTLGDGTTGLMAVKAHGGLTVVQDPQEAAYAQMPQRALQYAEIDYVLCLEDIAALLVRRAGEHAGGQQAERLPSRDVTLRPAPPAAARQTPVEGSQHMIYTCPDCGGPLQPTGAGEPLDFRCYQGHRYDVDNLLGQKSEAVETALWSAARALVERATLNRQLALQLRARGLEERASHLDEQADLDEAHMRLLRVEILHDAAQERIPAPDAHRAEPAGSE